MKIEVCNYTPSSIAYLLKQLEKHLPKGITNTPITLELTYADIYVDEKNELTVTRYDYLTSDGNSADFILDDSNLLYDDVSWKRNSLTVNGETFHLTPLSQMTSK